MSINEKENNDRYEEKRFSKRVSFNTSKDEDKKRLKKIKSIPDFSNWIKERIDEL
jgi:hypothetical protein